MSLQASCTPAQWRTLQFGPLWVFHAVASADEKIDDQEVAALATELQEAELFKEPIVREVLTSVAGDLTNVMQLYKADTRTVVQGLQEIADILDQVATSEQAQNYKGAMLLIGRKVAEASGGFLGLGSKISEKEKIALAGVALALRAITV